MTYPPEPDPQSTRKSLLMRLRPGESAREIAWHEFHARYSPIIAGFCRRMGVRTQDIADIIQDVLLGFFAVVPTFEYDPAKGRFRGYLKACTWRIFQRRLEKDLRLNGRSLSGVDPADIAVESAWNDVWESERLHQALEVVRERYLARSDDAPTFRAFEMYVLLGRSPAEVANELGISADSVYQAKARVSKALKSAFDGLSEDGD
jgi:RNA polymerase sigma factor (sigma-70 family)